MPALLVPAIVYLIPSSAAIAFGAGAAAVSYASIIASVVVVAGSYAASSMMASQPDFATNIQDQAAGKMTMTKSPTPTSRVCYGKNKISGPLAFSSTYGTKNNSLDLIILTAGHETSATSSYPAGHCGVYFNDILAIDDQGVVQSPYSNATVSALYKYGTTSQTAFDIQAPEWKTANSASRTLTGLSALHVHLENDPQLFPSGLPNISLVTLGKPCYDLRDGTTGYTENPSVILYDYITNFFGALTEEINTGSFIAAANICDETVTGSIGTYNTKRYTANFSFLTSEKPSNIIEKALKTCYGKLIYTDGQFKLIVGAYEAPIIELNESDCRGGVTVAIKSPSAQSYNKVTGLYVDGLHNTSSFQSAEFVPVTQSLYVSEDSGYENPLNIELSGVNNQRIARRLANLALIDSRNDLVVTFPCKPSGLQLTAGDLVYVSLSRFGFVRKLFEVTNLSINTGDLGVDLTLKETAASIYDWAASDQDVNSDLSPNTNLPNPFLVDVLTNFSASNVPVVDRDGTVFPGVSLTWTNPGSGSVAGIEIDYRDSPTSSYASLAKLNGGTSPEFTTLDVMVGNTYDFRARQYNYFNVRSEFVSASLTCAGDTTPPNSPELMSVVGTTGSLYVTWYNIGSPDYQFTEVWLNTGSASASAWSQGKISGTSWNKAISTSGTYYVWLKNIDTSGNQSALVSAGNAFVGTFSTITGSQGPSGSSGVAGSTGSYYETRYKVSDLVPTTPTGDNPSGWTVAMPSPTGAIWSSVGLKTAAGVLVGAWTTPARVSGNVDFYQSTAPTIGTNALITNDWWFDTSINRWYRWSGSAWVDANQIVSSADFGTGIRPVGYAASLPSLPTATWPVGSAFTVTGTGVLYRNKAEAWTAETTASLIVGTLVAGQIAAGAISATHVGTNLLVASSSNIGDAVITNAHITSLSAGKLTAGTIAVAVTLTAAEIISPRITGSSFLIDSTIGLRRSVNDGVLTLTGGTSNGSSYAAQIDMAGNNFGGASAGGQLVLQAGQGAASTISFLTNLSTTANVGVNRMTIGTDGLVNVTRNLSNGSVYTTNAGNLLADGNIGVGTTPQNTNSGVGQLDVLNAVNAASFNATSAARYKENIRPLHGAMATINKLEVKAFDWKDGSKINDVGFLAEQVAEIIPNIIGYKDGIISGLDYAKLTPFLISAIQEQQKTIDNMRQRIGVLERR